MTRIVSSITLIALAPWVVADEVPGSAELRMNQIQIIGTHNSYHQRPDAALLEQVTAIYPRAANWDYGHPSLDVQLENGVRNFELDLYHDPAAIRVFHVPRFDMNSNCETFVDCATVLRDWSRAHPRHVPVIVLMELKEAQIPEANMPVLPFDGAALAQLEKELLSVFEPGHLIRPDDVRGDTSSLKEAIESDGWPRLYDVRGRVMFVLHTKNTHYADGHPTLEGRAMFLQAYGDEPYAAVYVLNDPDDPEIQKRVRAGYIVRTRADSNLAEARAGDLTRRDRAVASGAHIITTDFPAGQAHEGTGYEVKFENGAAARVNAVARTVRE